MEITLIISIAGIVISLISLSLSIYNHFKRISDEKFRVDTSIYTIAAVDGLAPQLGITYVEMTVTNKSSMPLPITDAFLRIRINDRIYVKDPLVKNGNTVESNAYRFNTLISTHTESAGSNVSRTFEHKTNGLPITIPPKDSKHFILAFNTPYVLQIDDNDNLYLELKSHKDNRIIIENAELQRTVKSTRQFLEERLREA